MSLAGSFSLRRLAALCRKESYQVVRDPSSILVAFVLPVVLLFIFAYGINLDTHDLRIGLIQQDQGVEAIRLEQALFASSAFAVTRGSSRSQMLSKMAKGEVRAIVVIPNDFAKKTINKTPIVQLLTDGSDPNTAHFVANYLQGVMLNAQVQHMHDLGMSTHSGIILQPRYWFNSSTVSRNFLVPGAIAIVLTIIGALLTSLVIAREWERGTMEALLATPISRAELLLSKILPYYVLAMMAMFICLGIAVFLMHVPFRGSLFALFIMTTLFLGCALGMGLLLSTIFRNQFNAAQAALTGAFLPALMLSGFVFEIASMPRFLQYVTYLLPARYFSNALQTLFQVGGPWSLLWTNAACLILLMLFFLGLTALKTRRSLD